MKNIDFNQTVYIANLDCKGFPYIEETVLKERVREGAKETTSPRGVMPVHHVVHHSVMKWSCQKEQVVETFETPEEAEDACLEYWYKEYVENCDFNTLDCCNKEEVVVVLSEMLELDAPVIQDLLKWSAKYREIEANKIAQRLMLEFEKRYQAGPVPSKTLKRAASDIVYGYFYQYGNTSPHSSAKLNVVFPAEIIEQAKMIV